jgi:hypothetical protein
VRRLSSLGTWPLLKGPFVFEVSAAREAPHSNESPRLSVSVSAKREFSGQRQRRRKGPSHSTDHQQRQSPRTKTQPFGARNLPTSHGSH